MSNQPTICTIVSKNYLAYARCLTDSFLSHHPEGQVFVLLVDELEDAFDPAQERFTTILAKELNIPQFEQMAFRYFVYELNTAVKPFFLEYLFETYSCQKLCYIDPDIQFFRRIDEIFELLDSYGIVLLPHLTDFVEDGYLTDEISILRSGVYNLGFIGLSRYPELNTFIHWWQRKLRKHCTNEQEKGLYLDQRWIDLVPGLFSSVFIHRDPGYNVAYWNLSHRHFEATAGEYSVNGVPLKFYHFSGFNFDEVDTVARYQNRYSLTDLEQLAPLYYAYRDNLIAHGHVDLRELRYAYSYFDNGIFIPEFARYLWRAIEDELGQRWPNPFDTHQPDSFINWLNGPADSSDPDQTLVSCLALELYRHRSDLQAAFPDVLGQHRPAFARWFVRQAREENQIDDFFIEPARVSLAKTAKSGGRAREAIPSELLANEHQLGRSARTYLAVRDFLNGIGLGQRIRAVIGPEQVLKVRQFFFSISGQQATQQPSETIGLTSVWSRRGPIPSQPEVKSPFGLNVVGYLNAETGIGEVARSILKALHQQNFPVAQTNVNGYLARRNDTSVLHLPCGNPYPINLFNVNADQVPIVYETLGNDFFQNRYNIGFWFWELSHFPEMWHDRFNYFDEVWVGSNFVQAALAPAAPIPIVTMRVPIIDPGPSTMTRTDLALPTDKHLFLFVFDGLSYVERKNPLGLIQAYRTAFEPDFKDTTLIIKATNLSHNPELARWLRKEMKSVSGILIDRYTGRDELNGLFHACDTYVSLHRSEGFGMTMAEAMILGKPVIATAYSANMDFMSPANSYPVPYRLVELEADYGPYKKGNLWADPDIVEAATIMKRVIDNRDEARQKGQLAKQDIERFYGVETISQAIIKRLEMIHHWCQQKRTR